MRTAVLTSASETSHQRYRESLPGFGEAFEALEAVLALDAEKGWPAAGGFRQYRLALRGLPSVWVRYTFNDDKLFIHDIKATAIAGTGRLTALETSDPVC